MTDSDPILRWCASKSCATIPASRSPPTRATGDAGLDLVAAAPVTLPPGGRQLVPTGLRVAIPAGYAGLVLPRSGLALRAGVTVLNAPGLIDSGYRGEIGVLLDQPRRRAGDA